MVRKASTVTLEITADNLHVHDTLVCKDGAEVMVWERPIKRSGKVRIDTQIGRYEVPQTHLITVRLEHNCGCDGSGIFRGGGVVENGVYKGYEGACYGCAGKGYQTRSDVIRNATYWAKYARISA